TLHDRRGHFRCAFHRSTWEDCVGSVAAGKQAGRPGEAHTRTAQQAVPGRRRGCLHVARWGAVEARGLDRRKRARLHSNEWLTLNAHPQTGCLALARRRSKRGLLLNPGATVGYPNAGCDHGKSWRANLSTRETI